MEIHSDPIKSLNGAFTGLSGKYEALLKALKQAAPAHKSLRPTLAGAEILHAQHGYFLPFDQAMEPYEFRALIEALELESEWLCSKAAALCATHPELAVEMLHLAHASLALTPLVSEAWLWSSVSESPLSDPRPDNAPHRVAA